MQKQYLGYALGGALIIAVLAFALGGSDGPPDGFALANGRIEAERIDIATEFPGRLATVHVEEGDFVEFGAPLAELDADEMEAQVREAEAAVGETRRGLEHAHAVKAQRESELVFARQELSRAERLVERNATAQEVADQRQTAVEVAVATIAAADAEIGRAEAAISAAEARLARLQSNLEDYRLTAPKQGRVQYKLASVGEVLPAGGRILTLLDLTDVYMTVFLPTDEAGRLSIQDDARIILDAAPQYVIPASVTFVASEAQFTPKYVETEEERAKLMFRVKVRIPSDLLIRYQQVVKTGLPGVAYLRVDPSAEWPAELEPRLPQAPGDG